MLEFEYTLHNKPIYMYFGSKFGVLQHRFSAIGAEFRCKDMPFDHKLYMFLGICICVCVFLHKYSRPMFLDLESEPSVHVDVHVFRNFKVLKVWFIWV